MSDRFEPREPTAEDVRMRASASGLSLIHAQKDMRRSAVKSSGEYVLKHGTVEDKVNWLLRRYMESL